MPTVRQKWAKLVQQPMLTCWQASIVCPLATSVKELALPPNRCRASSNVTAKPRGASAAAAANPANPAPMIATRSVMIVAALHESCSGNAHFTKKDLLIQRSCSKNSSDERADGISLLMCSSSFPDSSTVEQPAVNRFVVGSNPTRGASPVRIERRVQTSYRETPRADALGVSRWWPFFQGFRYPAGDPGALCFDRATGVREEPGRSLSHHEISHQNSRS